MPRAQTGRVLVLRADRGTRFKALSWAQSSEQTATGALIVGILNRRPWCTFFCPFGLVSWLGERSALAPGKESLQQ